MCDPAVRSWPGTSVKGTETLDGHRQRRLAKMDGAAKLAAGKSGDLMPAPPGKAFSAADRVQTQVWRTSDLVERTVPYGGTRTYGDV